MNGWILANIRGSNTTAVYYVILKKHHKIQTHINHSGQKHYMLTIFAPLDLTTAILPFLDGENQRTILLRQKHHLLNSYISLGTENTGS